MKLEPTIRLVNENTCFWALDWANSERIAVGCTNGRYIDVLSSECVKLFS